MRLPTTALITFLACAAGACTGPTRTAGPADEHVRVAVLPFLAATPLYIGVEEGHFAARGLDVELVRFTSVREYMAALVAGQVDVAAGMVSIGILNAIGSGAPVRGVAAISELVPGECTFNGFITRRELLESGDLDDPERVRDMRFDADPLLPMAYWIDLLLQPLGLGVDDVELVDLPEPNAIDSLLDRNTDVANLAEPLLGAMAGTEDVVMWRSATDVAPGYPMSVLLYGGSLIDRRRDVGERFAAGLLAALRQFRDGKTERNLALVEAFTGLRAERARGACWPSGRDTARINTALLRGYQEWAYARGLVDRVLEDDEWIDHRFIEAAAAGLAR